MLQLAEQNNNCAVIGWTKIWGTASTNSMSMYVVYGVDVINYTHPHINLAVVCPFVCPFVCLFVRLSITFSSNPPISVKSLWNFTKPSTYVNVSLPNSLKMLQPVHITVCTHNTGKHAAYLCAFFATFLSVFSNFEAFPVWNWKKNEAAFQIGMEKTQLFRFIHFFQFSKEVLHNGWNVPKNGQNSTFLPLVGKIWHFGIKVTK